MTRRVLIEVYDDGAVRVDDVLVEGVPSTRSYRQARVSVDRRALLEALGVATDVLGRPRASARASS